MRRLAALSLVALSFAPSAFASDWEFDPAHSSAQFKVRHLMISNVPGKFSGLNGKVHVDDADITKSKVDATIDAATVNTDNEKRDTHLRSGDFFDVQKYPKMTFVSKKVTKSGNDLTVEGDLTIHGVTKPVTLTDVTLTPEMKDPFGGTRRGLSGHTKINRKDFGLTWNKALESGGVLVGDDVEISIDGELTKAK